jgi:hypothetical protein
MVLATRPSGNPLGHGVFLKTRCTTLVPIPSFRPILRIPSPLAFNSSIRASTASAMTGAAQGHRAELRRGRITGIVRRPDGSSVRGVEVDGGIIEADAVVVAMGPWSLIAAGWLSLPAVFGQRSPSLVYDTGTDVPADALFLDYHEEE